GCELPDIKKSQSKRSLCLQQKVAIICQLGPFDQAQAKIVRLVELAPDDAEQHETVKRPEQQVMFAEPLAQFIGAGEYRFDLWRGIAFRDEQLRSAINLQRELAV